MTSGTLLYAVDRLALSMENHVGAWWSGMLLLALSLHAADGSAREAKRSAELAQAWRLIAAIILFLSLDEIGSLHERVMGFTEEAGLGIWAFVVPMGAVLGAMFVRALWLMRRAGTPLATVILPLVVGFGLLGSVPIQEFLEHELVFDSTWAKAARVSVEEGTELLGMLLLLWTMMAHTAPFSAGSPARGPAFDMPARCWATILAVGIVVAPFFAWITAGVDDDGLGRPADWTASAAFALAAAMAVRPAMLGVRRFGLQEAVTASLCLCASVIIILSSADGIRSIFGLDLNPRLVVLAVICLGLVLMRASLVGRGAGLRNTGLLLMLVAAISAPNFFEPSIIVYTLTQLMALGTFATFARDSLIFGYRAAH